MLRVHLPRVYGIFEPLRDLPRIREAFSYNTGLPGILMAFGDPGISNAFGKLAKVGAEMMKWSDYSREKSMEAMALGFPRNFGGGTHAPFDMIGDFIRGTKGIMLDKLRCPDKLISAMEKAVPMLIRMGLRGKKQEILL